MPKLKINFYIFDKIVENWPFSKEKNSLSEISAENNGYSLQTDEVLSKDSAAEVEDGKTPGPMIEIRFWEAKCMNLESLFEQVELIYQLT